MVHPLRVTLRVIVDFQAAFAYGMNME